MREKIYVADEATNIKEVDELKVKQALKALLTTKSDLLKHLYSKHAEYNRRYFENALSHPLITIEKMNNRTLGNYTLHGSDSTGLNNHIRMNRTFCALNTEERIDETLLHEMVHQWQDEEVYLKAEEDPDKYPNKKKRPKANNWHNKDFFDKAKEINLPAKPPKGFGSPCNMPKGKSYNRKYMCGCIASNGYPLTIWSTRPVSAKCTICGQVFEERGKRGEVIPVTQSHVEKGKEDAVEKAKKAEGFLKFQRFLTKDGLDDFLLGMGTKEYVDGLYQKKHNMYEKGFRYWVAYSKEGGK